MTVRRLSVVVVLVAALVLSSLLYGDEPKPGEKKLEPVRPGSAKWAVLIGVDRYTNARGLDFCGKDVASLKESLVAAGFPEDHVFLLNSGAKEDRDRPFKANIEQRLDLVLGEVDEKGQLTKDGLVAKGDLVVVAFSGHGVHLDKTSYLCPAETRLDRPQSLLSLEQVYRPLQACPAARKLLLVDACRNNPYPDGGKDLKGDNAPVKDFAKSLESPPKGILVLTSCAAGQQSWEDPELGHGVFMHYLLEGLGGAADVRSRGQVTMLDLYQYASDKTKTFVAKSKNVPQTPTLRGELEEDFAIGPITGKEIANNIGMKLALVPAGRFTMGSPKFEGGRYEDEVEHDVEITKDFCLGKYEVTVGQFRAFVKDSGYRTEPEKDGEGGWGFNAKTGTFEGRKPEYTWRNTGWEQTDDHPVVNVTWNDAVAFCDWLSRKEGKKYRLPTEAEWEYSCRARTTTRFWSGNDEEGLKAVANIADASLKQKWADATWAKSWDDGYPFTAPVGKFRANAFGLYDMHGNAWEWCQDVYAKDYYKNRPKPDVDPQGPEATAGASRVIRGGAWGSDQRYCRAATRSGRAPSPRLDDLGFRVLRVR